MRVRDALVELRLPGQHVKRRLVAEGQPVGPRLDINDAWDMLLRMDDVARRLCEANDPDIDRTSRQAVELASIERLDSGAVGKRLCARTNSGCGRTRRQ